MNVVNNVDMSSLGDHAKIARTKTSTQSNTNKHKIPRRNRHLENTHTILKFDLR